MSAGGTESIKRLVELGVNASPAIAELKKLNAAAEQQLSSMDRLRGGLQTLGGVLGGVFAAKEIVNYASMFVNGVQSMIDSMDELSKAAQGLGMTTTQLQELSFALDLSGLDKGQSQRALASLSEALGKLGDDSENTTRLLKSMGITASDDVSSAFDKMAEAFANAPDGLNKTNVAIEIFGARLGPKMVAALNGGAEATAELKKELHDLGGVIEDDTIKQAEEFNDNMSKLTIAGKGLGQVIVADMLPSLVKFTNGMIESIKQGTLLKDTWNAFLDAGRGIGRFDSLGIDVFGHKAAEAAQATKEADARLAAYRKTQQGYAEDVARMLKPAENLAQANIKVAKSHGARAKAAKDDLTEMQKWEQSMKAAAESAALVPEKIIKLQEAMAKIDTSTEQGKLRMEAYKKALDALDPDPVAKAFAKIADEAKKLDEVPAILAAMETQLVLLKAAGKDASTEATVLRAEYLKMKSLTDPIAAVTVELEKQGKEAARNAAMWEEYERRFADGEITVEQYSAGVRAHLGDVNTAIKENEKAAKSLSDTIAEGAASFVTDWVGQMVDGFGKTSASFEDMIEDMIKMVAKLIIQYQVAAAVKAMGIGTASTGGLSVSMAPQPVPTPTTPSTTTQVSAGFLGSPSAMASTGTTLSGGSGSTAWGGRGMGGETTINITNNAAPDVQVSARTTDNKDNSRIVDILVEQKVKKMMSDGSMDRTMRANYGATRQPAMG